MSLLPSSPDVSPDGDPRVVGLDSDEADDLMAALSSTTARKLLSELHQEPAPPAELADRVDTSLQNVQYHLGNLEEAGVVEVVGTAYSEKGREMNVYGPADSPLVIFAGEQERVSGLRAAISKLFGGILALAVGSVVVQELFGTSILGIGPDPAPEDDVAPATEPDDADVATTPSPTPEETPEDEPEIAADTPSPEETPAPDAPTETPVAEPAPTPEAVETGLDAILATGLPPGLAFFLGGTVVLIAIVLLQYR